MMGDAMTQAHKDLVIPNDTKYLATVRESVRDVVKNSAFPDKDINRIILAVDEAVANIMEHAYENARAGDKLSIELKLDADATRFEVVIIDSGREFDPSEIDVPNMDEHVAQGKKNGLGIFLMRQIMDEVQYTFVQGFRNELRMVKYVRE